MSSELELWALMVLGGQKWSERLGVCDPRVRGALLAFSQLPLALQGVFANLPPFRKSISQFEGHLEAWR